MEIRQKRINNRKWQLVNETWETSRAWGHKTTVLCNGFNEIEHSVRYYNRTWECYRYQTCMFGAVETLREQEQDRFIENYKEEKGIYRFKKGEKEQVIKEFNKTQMARDLNKLHEAISLNKFN